MTNKEIAKILYEIADYLEMEDVQFKPYAYKKAAITLENLEKDVREIYREGGIKALNSIPGVGESIALKIEEYLKTGKIKYHQELKRKLPINLEELVAIEGMGPKKAKVLYKKLRIKNIKDLEKAAKAHKIAPLFGFGEKTEKNILQGIAFFKRSKGRFLLGEILPVAHNIIEKIGSLKEVRQISLAGSVRRKKETIGDVDILVVCNEPERVMDFFVSMPGVVKIWGKGSTKSSVRTEQGFDIDLRVIAEDSFGSALQYFTGSKEHNIATRKIAIKKGLKLNEYGVFKGNKKIAGRTEEDVYAVLGMRWMPPEIRENRGEIELSLEGKLPRLVELKDIKGDLHCHSNWDGGKNSIEEMAQSAILRNYQYLGITDHTKFLKIEHGLNERQLSQQRKEIDKLNSKFKKNGINFHIFHGAETNILKDGRIDISDSALKRLDYAIAGIHSNFRMKKNKMTERIISAMKNPYIKIISHPTGRILKKRDEYEIDIDRLLRAAKQFNVVLEINSYPERLDLNDVNIKKAREMGIRMAINTDAHHKDQLRYMEFGIYQARRGWAEKKDIINTKTFKQLKNFFRGS